MSQSRQARARLGRRLSWLVVAAMAASALFLPAGTAQAASFNGAIFTEPAPSTSTTVNANQYALKSDVYLNGGPNNAPGCHRRRTTMRATPTTSRSPIPSGATLLSTDAIKFRMVEVVNGVIAGVGGTGNHDEGSSGCNGGTCPSS